MQAVDEAQADAEGTPHSGVFQLQPLYRADGEEHRQAEAVAPDKVAVHGASPLLRQAERFEETKRRHADRKEILFPGRQLFHGQSDHQPAEADGAKNRQLRYRGVHGEGIPGGKGNAVSGFLSEQHRILP